MTGNGVTNISGNVSGVWTPENSPYYLVGSVNIPDGESLTILPGVTVINNSDHYFYVYGELIAEGTLEDSIYFISDNGGPTKELTASNLPLRDGKGSVYEGAIRIPYLVQWKGQLRGNRTYDYPVTSLDIFSTALAVSKSNRRTDRIYDGVNLIPHLTGETTQRPHVELFWRQGAKTALRQEDWKLLRNPRRGQSNAWELYDLSKDTSEQNNLASTYPQKLTELEQTWKQWNDQMIPPVWSPRSRAN